MATKDVQAINLPQMERRRMDITLIGDSPLICHAWSKKAIGAMLDKQMKRAKGAKEAKDPERDFLESLYYLPEHTAKKPRYGFPSVAFKNAAVTACTSIDGVTKVQARQAFHVEGDMVEIIGTPQMREDMVRVGMGTADIRYRGEFPTWRTTFTVVFNVNALSAEQIMNLFNTAGFGVGIGEWRPEKDGQFGRFHVATTEEMELPKAA